MVLEYQIWTTTFINKIFISLTFEKNFSLKMCTFFDSSQLSCLTIFQKILWGCLFGCRNLLNFICFTKTFIHFCSCLYWPRAYSKNIILRFYTAFIEKKDISNKVCKSWQELLEIVGNSFSIIFRSRQSSSKNFLISYEQ